MRVGEISPGESQPPREREEWLFHGLPDGGGFDKAGGPETDPGIGIGRLAELDQQRPGHLFDARKVEFSTSSLGRW